MSPAERLAKLLAAEPAPTVEIVVAGEKFTARVRCAEAFREGLLEVLLGPVSAPAPATVAQLPLMPSEIPMFGRWHPTGACSMDPLTQVDADAIVADVDAALARVLAG